MKWLLIARCSDHLSRKIGQLMTTYLKVFYSGEVGRAGMNKNRHEVGSGFWGLHPLGSAEL